MQDNLIDFEFEYLGDSLLLDLARVAGLESGASSQASNTQLIKTKLKELVADKSERVSLVDCDSSQECLKNFKTILFDQSETSFVHCSFCSSLFKLNQAHLETIRAHPDTCVGLIDRQVNESGAIGQALKFEFANECAFYSATDCRALSLFGTAGFTRLAQQLINIGHNYGNIDASKVLPHGSTVSRHVPIVANSIRAHLVQLIRTAPHIALIFDHWSTKFKKTKFFGIKLFYRDSNQFRSRLLCAIPVTSADAVSTLRHYNECVALYQIDETKISANVSDNTPANPATVRSKKADWIGCAAHQVNLIIQALFDPKNKMYRSSLRAYIEVCTAVRNLVSYYNRSKKFELDISLKQEFEIRWDTKYLMCLSVLVNELRLLAIRGSNKETQSIKQLVDAIDFEVLRELVPVLKLFYEARLMISTEQKSTLNLVLPIKKKLLIKLAEQPGDSERLNNLKNAFRREITNRLVVNETHLIATFLTPKFRKMTGLVEELELEMVIGNLSDMIAEMPSDQATHEADFEVSQMEFDDDLEMFAERAVLTDERRTTNEIEQYLAMPLCSDDLNQDPYLFWSKEKIRRLMPKLSIVALRTLVIPATSCPIERSFSQATLTLSHLRTQLSGEKLNDLLVINSNSDLF